jgi:hypothetical protein
MEFIDLNSLPDTRKAKTTTQPEEHVTRCLAYHEAGHAVIGLTVGMSLASTQLIRSQNGIRFMRTGSTTWNSSTVLQFDFAVECAAGGVAEGRHMKNQKLRGQPDDAHDWDTAVAALARSDYQLVRRGRVPANGATFQQVRDAAEKAVRQHWSAITAVAAALYAAPEQRLTGDQVARIARIPNPRPTKEH